MTDQKKINNLREDILHIRKEIELCKQGKNPLVEQIRAEKELSDMLFHVSYLQRRVNGCAA